MFYHHEVKKEEKPMKPIRRSTILIGLSLALVFMMGCGLVDQAKEQVTNKVGEIANDAVELIVTADVGPRMRWP